MRIQLKKLSDTTSNPPLSVNIDENVDTVESLKTIVTRDYCPDIQKNDLRLVYQGKMLSPDTALLKTFNINENSIIHVLRKTTSTPNTQAGTTSTASIPTSNPFGAPYPPNFNSMQNYFNTNPQVFEEMIGSDLMQSILSNRDVMDSILQMNPQMKTLLENNPELREMFNDPSFMKQTMEAMKNPDMMKEMMRNTDRAMSNIESIPGGHDALTRMYNQVAEPMLNATGAPAPKFDAQEDYGHDTETGNTEMPNPWGPSNNSSNNTPINEVPNLLGGFNGAALNSLNRQVHNAQQQQQNQPGNTGFPQIDPNTLNSLFTNPQLAQSLIQLENTYNTVNQNNNPSNPFLPVNNPQQQQQQLPVNNFNNLFSSFLGNANTTPEVRFRTQLASLSGMGFTDVDKNIAALEKVGGNVNRAIDELLKEN